jgi:hypothetical protein
MKFHEISIPTFGFHEIRLVDGGRCVGPDALSDRGAGGLQAAWPGSAGVCAVADGSVGGAAIGSAVGAAVDPVSSAASK